RLNLIKNGNYKSYLYFCAKIFQMYRTHTCGELRMEHIGQVVTLAGWVQKSRDLGGMTFLDLRDRYGITQLTFNEVDNADLTAQARKLGREYVIQITGEVIERASKNKNIPTGEIEIKVTELTVLNAKNYLLSQSKMIRMEV